MNPEIEYNIAYANESIGEIKLTIDGATYILSVGEASLLAAELLDAIVNLKRRLGDAV